MSESLNSSFVSSTSRLNNRTNRVCVYCRLAPSRESEALCLSALDAEARSIELQRDSHPVRQYQFDGIFSPKSSSQSDVFDNVAKDLVDDVLSGWNATCLAYGQTGTGKTYTMLGPALAGLVDGNNNSTVNSSSFINNNTPLTASAAAAETSGIIPRAVSRIFDQLLQSTDKSTFVVQASYVQLYCEAVYDLLQGYSLNNNVSLGENSGAGLMPSQSGGMISSSGAFSSSSSLQIREDPETGVFVEGATWVTVTDAAQCLAVLASGSRNRAVAATLMNAQSSRSHAIFMLRVERRIPAAAAASSVNPISSASTPKSAAALVARVQRGTLFLVDLAGSERQSRSGVAGVHLDEMRAINLSLSALGNCISALASRGDSSRTSTSVHVPYRDSKLTRLLQDSLGGNARTSLVVTVSQASHSALETQSTLEFGSRAAKVTVHAVRNEVVDYRALYMALKLGGGINSASQESSDATITRSANNPDGYVLIREEEFSRLKERELALSEEVAALRAMTTESNGIQEMITTPDSVSNSRAPSPSVRSMTLEENGSTTQVPRLSNPPSSSSNSLSSAEAADIHNNAFTNSIHLKKTATIGTSPIPQPSMINASVNAITPNNISSGNTSGSANTKCNPPGSIVLTAQAQEVMSRQLARLKAELGLAKSDLDKSQDSLLSAVREQRKLKERVKDAEKELTVRVSTLLEEVNEARARAEEAEEKARIAEDEAEAARKELRSSISGGGGGAIHAARAGAVSEVTRLYEASISGLQKRVGKVEERCQMQANLVQELAYRLRVRERQVQVQKLQAKRAQEALWRGREGGGEDVDEGGVEDIEAEFSQDSLSAIVNPSLTAVAASSSVPVGSGVSAVAAALRHQRPMSEGSGVRALGQPRSNSLLEQHSHAISSAAERDGAFLQPASGVSTRTERPSSLLVKPVMMTMMMGGVGSLAQTQPAPVPRLSSASIAASNAALFGLGSMRPSTSTGGVRRI